MVYMLSIRIGPKYIHKRVVLHLKLVPSKQGRARRPNKERTKTNGKQEKKEKDKRKKEL